MKKSISKSLILAFLPLLFLTLGCATTSQVGTTSVGLQGLDTIKAQRFDTGKMWTFEDAPVDYFKETYGFAPDQEWLDDVRMSALKFANWCSSSFVSEDGLVMTNHHCIDFVSSRINKEGEDIRTNGFYAETLEDERPIPGVFVRQLRLVEDVTESVKEEVDAAKTKDEKIKAKAAIIKELEDQYSNDSGLECSVIELYNGGKYSIYGYKRFNDVRAVYFNEAAVGLYGGDPDNFTYPRYDADFAFVRVYGDDGKPLKTDHYFKFSPNGAKIGEPIFVVGNPGSTKRLKTVAQLEYLRDYSYKNANYMLNGMLKNLYTEMKEHPEKEKELEGSAFMLSNSAKVYKGRVEGMADPKFIARKRAFENNCKKAVMAEPKLNAKYGHLWEGIEQAVNEMRKISNYISAYSINARMSPALLTIGKKMAELGKQLQKPEADRDDAYKGENLDKTIEGIFPAKYDESMQNRNLALHAGYLAMLFGTNNELVMNMYGGKKGEEAVKFALANSLITSKDDVIALAKKGADAILNSSDPFINFALKTQDKLANYKAQAKEIKNTESVLENELGQALFEVYGTTIPPDATFTLRINDGVMKKYEYNGTEAPEFTTFYGMYDRYYSHSKQFPWKLPERWLKFNEDFDLETPYNFISTNDIIGGSSGSAVINKNKEIVGIAFDGNIESLPGDFLYDTKANRMVSVASQGILEIVGDLFHLDRLANELKNGKIVN